MCQFFQKLHLPAKNKGSSTKMKILFYLPTPGGLTGAPRRMLTLACGLRDLGVIPIIATEPGTALSRAAKEAGIETVSLLPVGVLALRDGALFSRGLIFRLRVAAALLVQQLRFRRVVRDTDADVVWTRSGKGIAFSIIGVLLSRRPLVWDVVNEMYTSRAMRLLLKLGLTQARSAVFQHSRVRDAFGEKLIQRYGAKMRVITPGVDVGGLSAARMRAKFDSAARHSRFRLLQVGTLCDNKNQLFLINILHQLPHDIRRRVQLCIVGGTHSASYERELREEVAARGMTQNVKFLGWRDDVHAIMLESDLLVMPSKSEGVPNTVQEAMVLGLPVLCSDQGGIPEIVQHKQTGWFLPLSDTATWVETVAWLVENPENLSKVRLRAQEYAEQEFGIDNWCRRYLTVFEESARGT